MNILCATDKNYLDKTQTMLVSLRKHVREEIVVYLMNKQLVEGEISAFRKYLKKYRISLNVIDASRLFDGIDVPTGRWGIEMYFRLFAQFLLPDSVDRILWLDGDIIIKKDITDFYYQPFEERYYVVCRDICRNHKIINERKKMIGIPEECEYFNSGVLLINIAALRIHTDMEYIYSSIVQKRETVLYPDQDILNYLYYKNVKYADDGYNFMEIANDAEDAAILHYASCKPWGNLGRVENFKYWWNMRLAQGHILEWWKNWGCLGVKMKIRKAVIGIVGEKAFNAIRNLGKH